MVKRNLKTSLTLFFFNEIKLVLPQDSTIPLLDTCPRENGTESMQRLTQQCSQVFNDSPYLKGDKFSSLENGSKAYSVPTVE